MEWQYENAKKALETYNRRVKDLKDFIELGKKELKKKETEKKNERNHNEQYHKHSTMPFLRTNGAD